MVAQRRNFRLNPVTSEELMNCYWFAVENDLIGGYSVCTVNKPESQQNVYDHEFEIGTFMTLECAQHMADLHNIWWDAKVWMSYYYNIEWTLTLDEEEGYADLALDRMSRND